MSKEIVLPEPCASCHGACCGFKNKVTPVLELTDEEVEFLRLKDTKLIVEAEPEIKKLSAAQITILLRATDGEIFRKSPHSKQSYATTIFHGAYILESPCGWGISLPNGSVICSANGNPNRPEVCSSFTAGGEKCLEMKTSN